MECSHAKAGPEHIPLPEHSENSRISLFIGRRGEPSWRLVSDAFRLQVQRGFLGRRESWWFHARTWDLGRGQTQGRRNAREGMMFLDG